MGANHSEKRLQTTLDTLQKQGFRLTQARRIILDTFITAGGHLSADDLAERVHTVAPQVGRMTVYRTLELLCELGVVRPIYQGTGAAHYIFLHEGHHHHLVCNLCHQVIEFDDCALEEVAKVICGRFNFRIQGHLLELYGICPKCQE
ncbi:MAG: transcriptional repressor [Chloroflexi bacterium]|nr:transcriptional repressor [Chloroflexota bacterium]MBP8057532.1 transcriptional repressor [Chloroflexota bacterium]